MDELYVAGESGESASSHGAHILYDVAPASSAPAWPIRLIAGRDGRPSIAMNRIPQAGSDEIT